MNLNDGKTLVSYSLIKMHLIAGCVALFFSMLPAVLMCGVESARRSFACLSAARPASTYPHG